MLTVRRGSANFVVALVLLAGLMAVVPAEAQTSPTAGVFINELHYDNTGGDTGEFVEVAGPGGTDLDGWSIALYNGRNSQLYGTIDLSGTIPDQDDGFGAIAYSRAGIQNGSPDGLALIGPGSVVVEFWSYEGSFTASDGPAAGVTSTDIGVLEPGGDPIGQSLQKIGTGTLAGDFAWQSPAVDSPGMVNVGQDFVGGPADPVINEFGITDASADQEFIEVFGDANTDYSAYTVIQIDATGADGAIDHVVGAGTTDSNGIWATVLNANAFENGSSTLLLVEDFSGVDGQDLDTDGDGTLDVEPWARVVDAVAIDDGDAGATFYGQPVLDETFDDARITNANPPGGGSRIPDGADTDSAADWYRNDFDWDGATNGSPALGEALNTPGAPNQIAAAPPPATLINEVQGSGSVAALNGQVVTVQGVVTSLFTRDDVLDGFFVQEEDADVDGDPATSEGIFVFCRQVGCPGALATGDLVTVTGTVVEAFEMSQIDTASGSIVIDSSGNPLPTPAPVDLPASGRTDAPATFEAVEGMVVSFADELVISEYFQLARYGEILLTVDARPQQFTVANAPSAAGYAAFLDDLASRRIILDDDNNDQNDATSDVEDNEAYRWPEPGLSTSNLFRGGDSITDLTGVMHYSFAGQSGTDAWRIRPVVGVDYTFTANGPRPAAPADVGGTMTVTSFNVLNFFNTLDNPGNTCGPRNLGCRGANSNAELERQRQKIVAALVEIDADVVGLVEIENDAGAATDDLVAALNAATGPGSYAALQTGTIGGDAIKVALIYKPAVVTPVGNFAILDSSVDSRFIDTKNRPVLVQTFEENSSGGLVTVAVNHLKSKGSPCDNVGDPNANDGQGNCNGTRTDAAAAMADFLAGDPTGTGADNILIIGDLNAYAMEDPVTTLETAGYTDLIETFEGPSAYSFVFDGQLGYLDHALANEALLQSVTGVTEWHINADEINILDYNDDVRDPNEPSIERESTSGGLDLFDPDPYRSSDHDPVIVGLDLARSAPLG